jgi:hypothetical protein
MFCTQKLHFVPETGTARPNGTLRDLIRSNARRKPRRRPRKSSGLANLQPRSKENSSKTVDPLELSGSNSSDQSLSGDTNIRFYRGPECNAIDPFYTLPISEAGQSQFLIHHCEFHQILGLFQYLRVLPALAMINLAGVIGASVFF